MAHFICSPVCHLLRCRHLCGVNFLPLQIFWRLLEYWCLVESFRLHTDVIKGFSYYVLTKDVEQSKPHIFCIKFVLSGYFPDRVLHFAFPVHTSNWFIPQFNSRRFDKWWILLWSECSSALLEHTDPGHCRHRTWIASDGLLYRFFFFFFFFFFLFWWLVSIRWE